MEPDVSVPEGSDFEGQELFLSHSRKQESSSAMPWASPTHTRIYLCFVAAVAGVHKKAAGTHLRLCPVLTVLTRMMPSQGAPPKGRAHAPGASALGPAGASGSGRPAVWPEKSAALPVTMTLFLALFTSGISVLSRGIRLEGRGCEKGQGRLRRAG